MPHLTETDLDAIRQRAEAATPGPWTAIPMVMDANGRRQWHIERNMPDIIDVAVAMDGYGVLREGEWNANFIAHARTDIPQLLAAIDERDAIIHDMQIDSDAYRRGAENSFRQSLDILRKLRATALSDERNANVGYARDTAIGRIQMANMAIDILLILAGLKQCQNYLPLPPDAARARTQRYREALEAVKDLIRGEASSIASNLVLELINEALEGNP